MKNFKDKIRSITWVLFLVSFVPYLLLVQASFFGTNMGINISGTMYGLSAVFFVCFVYTFFIPIFDVCFLYQLIYAFTRLRQESQKRKRIAVILAVGTILLSLIPACIHEVVLRVNAHQEINEELPAIEAYLKEHYSQEFVDTCRIKTDTYGEHIWVDVDRKFLGNQNYFNISRDLDGTYFDDFVSKVAWESDSEIGKTFSDYVSGVWNMPEHWGVKTFVYEIDMHEFSFDAPVSAIFPKTRYQITDVVIDMEQFDEEKVMDELRLFGRKYYPNMKDELDMDLFNIYVRVDGEYYASYNVTKVNSASIRLHSGGYTREDGTQTIPEEWLHLTWEAEEADEVSPESP